MSNTSNQLPDNDLPVTSAMESKTFPCYHRSASCSHYALFKDDKTLLQIYTGEGMAIIQECTVTESAIEFFITNGVEVSKSTFLEAYSVAKEILESYLDTPVTITDLPKYPGSISLPPAVATLPVVSPEDECTILVPTKGSNNPYFYVVYKGRKNQFLTLREALLFAAKEKLREVKDGITTSSDLFNDPFMDIMNEDTLTADDKLNILRELENIDDGYTPAPGSVFTSDDQLLQALDREFPGAIWPTDKLSIASEDNMKRRLEKLEYRWLTQVYETPEQKMIRELKNASYHDLVYCSSLSPFAKKAA